MQARQGAAINQIERSECKPDRAQPQDRALPSIKLSINLWATRASNFDLRNRTTVSGMMERPWLNDRLFEL